MKEEHRNKRVNSGESENSNENPDYTLVGFDDELYDPDNEVTLVTRRREWTKIGTESTTFLITINQGGEADVSMADQEGKEVDFDAATLILPESSFNRMLSDFFRAEGIYTLADFRKKLNEIIEYQHEHGFKLNMVTTNGIMQSRQAKKGTIQYGRLAPIELDDLKKVLDTDLVGIESAVALNIPFVEVRRLVYSLMSRFVYEIALTPQELLDDPEAENRIAGTSFVLKEQIVRIIARQYQIEVGSDDDTKPHFTARRDSH